MSKRFWRGARLRATLPACIAFVILAQSARAEVKEVMVPMRDGVKLATNISTPAGEGPWPVILTRTPYNAKGRGARAGQPLAAEQGTQYLTRGYAYVTQDVRGMFASEGQYLAFQNDMEDGFDTVEWIATQRWSNGKVGMVGTSAMGITSNMAAMAAPPHLVCAFVSASHGDGYENSRHPGGVYLLSLVEDWMRQRGTPVARNGAPLSESPSDQDKKLDMAAYYAKMNIPMYNAGGWYDIFLQGNIDAFSGLQANGGDGAKGRQDFDMGAWGHTALQGDLKYPPAAGRLGGPADEQMRFFDHYLKGVDNGIDKEPAVDYFVMGDAMNPGAPGNEWRKSDTWPPTAKATPYYLAANNTLTTAKPAGDLTEGASNPLVSTFVYDPNDPVPSAGGNNLSIPSGPVDQRTVSARPDVLKFETAPLEHATEVVGPIKATLYVSTTAEDTDFFVKLIDVYPNGYEALVRDQGSRLRFREGFDKMVKAEPGKVYKLEVDLWSTALVFDKGHKISIQIQSSNNRRFEPHSNTWEPVADYKTQALKATNTIHYTADSPSSIVLPITKVYE